MQTLKFQTVLLLFSFFTPSAIIALDLELKAGPNRELVLQNCVTCHSAKLIKQHQLTRKLWDEKITWMQEKQNMWELSKEQRKKILDYLESVQGPEQQNKKDSMNPKLYRKNPNILVHFKKKNKP